MQRCIVAGKPQKPFVLSREMPQLKLLQTSLFSTYHFACEALINQNFSTQQKELRMRTPYCFYCS